MISENKDSTIQRYLSYFFILLLLAGVVLLIFSFVTAEEGKYFGGLQQIAMGITLIGLGEWINHPLQKSVAVEDKKNFIFQRIKHRKRRPNGIGNLLEIVGLLLVFTGFAEYL
ncbi:MAG: hypothetical protein QNJ17_00640 [Desulfocapsaceae bacterium]|nr:hypothetical protein [Desulfocapsaceae bacterium]